MQRAWEHELPTLQALAAQGGVSRQFLQDVVQEYYWRGVSYAAGCWMMLNEQLGIPFVPIMRSLYEAYLALAFLSDRSDADRVREAQIATAHQWFHVLWQIDEDRRDDPGGTIRAEVEDVLRELGASIPADVLDVARGRRSCFSWTGLNVADLVARYDPKNPYYALYSGLSSLGHGHHRLIARHVMQWSSENFERQAAHARRRLRLVRRLMQDTLALRFSDATIDEYLEGDTMIVRLPHANIRAHRP